LATGTTMQSDRPVGRRFVRNLALSLSGGALLTVAGAAVAGADEASTASDGAGVTGTGDATAVGNTSGTQTNQGVAPGDGSSNPTVVTQTAGVANVGVAVANTGGNVAVGNSSTNVNAGTQNATGGALVTSNNGSVANVSDGTAAIYTGDATAYGNVSETAINQNAHGALGILTSQTAGVANVGVGISNTGLNAAVGNGSTNTAGFLQTATNPTGVASNSASATNASNGSATIRTGAATATGNKSETWIDQTAGGTGDSDPGGLLIISQTAGVLNAGAALANSGGNLAVGNISTNTLDTVDQDAEVDGAAISVLPTIASNQLDLDNGGDGTANIRTGNATATGNDSNTNITQASWGDPDQLGAIVSFQAAGVANVGIGAANTGLNAAVGNVSISESTLEQDAEVDGAPPVAAIGPVTASNSASLSNSSDGTANIHTGDATATGNRSMTDLVQESHATVEPGGMGILPNVQAAGVLNAGVGIANSGVNGAVGNASGQIGPNTVDVTQSAFVDGAAVVAGPITAFNTADVSNSSDGTAHIKTGDATATGNTSETVIHQRLDTTIEDMGVIVAPQLAGVVNVGLGVANSGVNAAVGNASTNEVDATADATFDPAPAALVLGPVTVGNTTSASNDSDGEACVCTGDATASGNVSSTTITQDLDATVDTGFQIVPMSAVVINAGVGVANSGVNLAVGNISDNSSTLVQSAQLDPGAPVLLVGPQTIVNGGGASNTSNGAAKVGSGNATAAGNVSDTTVAQAADVDGNGSVAVINAATLNAGLGLANSGVNLGVGNASTNDATLTQTTSGVGTVSNQGEASNDSDGTALINYPCEDKVVAPPKVEVPGKAGPGQPGVASLPRTGGAVETMAAVGLMLLLLGLGAQGLSRRRVNAAA
jgi:hypothetical protein